MVVKRHLCMFLTGRLAIALATAGSCECQGRWVPRADRFAFWFFRWSFPFPPGGWEEPEHVSRCLRLVKRRPVPSQYLIFLACQERPTQRNATLWCLTFAKYLLSLLCIFKRAQSITMGKKRPSTEVTEAVADGAHVPQAKKTKTGHVKKSSAKSVQKPLAAGWNGSGATYCPMRDYSACVIFLAFLNRLADLDSHRFYHSSTGNTAVPPIEQNLNKLFDNYRGEGHCL